MVGARVTGMIDESLLDALPHLGQDLVIPAGAGRAGALAADEPDRRGERRGASISRSCCPGVSGLPVLFSM
jgi:hypothetical protein